MSDAEFIHVVTEANFELEVIQRSMQTPVLVDFWADWCNPCKILMPILSKLAREYNGAFHLAKINTEEQRNLAAQHRVRSLPTVRMYLHGEVVDEFNGAIPEGTAREFIDRNLPKPEDETLQRALLLISEGQPDQALPLLQQVVQLNPTNKKAVLALADLYLLRSDQEALSALLEHLPIKLADDDEVQSYVARMHFLNISKGAPDVETLKNTIAHNNNDVEAHYQLGAHCVVSGDFQTALDCFLQVITLDRKFGDDAGRKAVLDVFKMLGGSGPLVTMYRMKMASLLH